ncbi:major facilitator superfamily domain-containing protein [Blakeslea trispora]|nr:major facilitator superfamily domain-containing protein [Blakeslea trispora]
MSEATPLLNRHTPTKATAWHAILPFSLATFVAGAMAAPIVELFAISFCYEYYKSKSESSELDIPIGDCAIPEVQKLASEAQGLYFFLLYTTSLISASYYGRLSDRKGRRTVFIISVTGACFAMLSYLLKFNYPEYFGTSVLFIVATVYGLCGGDTLISGTVQAYIADCTSHSARSTMFSHLVAACSISSALGSYLSSYIISSTGSIHYVIWMSLLSCLAFLLYIIFFLPESHVPQASSTSIKESSLMQQLNVFSSLHVFSSTNHKRVGRYALLLCAIVDSLLAFIAFPPTLLYAMYKFGWTAYEGGIYSGLVNIVRFVTTSLVVPYVSRQFHKLYLLKQQPSAKMASAPLKKVPVSKDNTIEEDEATTTKSLILDVWMIRVCFVFEALGFFLFASTNSSNGIMMSGVIRGFGTIGTPAICSFMSKLVDPSEIGELSSALSIIESISNMASQLTLTFIYGASVGSLPQLVFYLCAGVSCLAFVITMLIRYNTSEPCEVEQEA